MSRPDSSRSVLCTWAIPNFPRRLKATYGAYCRANQVFVCDHLEYLIAKTLREARVDIPPLRKDNHFIQTVKVQ